jgi:nitrate reductase NapD
MKIVSLVIKYFPEHAQAVQQGVEAVEGASVAHDHDDGRMIVLVEDGEGYAVSDSIIRIHQVPHIMSVTLAYEYSDDALVLEEVSP